MASPYKDGSLEVDCFSASKDNYWFTRDEFKKHHYLETIDSIKRIGRKTVKSYCDRVRPRKFEVKEYSKLILNRFIAEGALTAEEREQLMKEFSNI